MKTDTPADAQPDFDFVKEEHRVLDFWREQRCFELLREQNRDGPLFRFLDGPITANNAMGVHHAWGRTLKDVFLRFKAMQGFLGNWQNGFDTQGLWVEVEVERELGFKNKRDIESFGVERFVEACKARTAKFAQKISEQSQRLGMWMDWDHSYYTNADVNIEGIWHFLRTCHDSGWIYQDLRLTRWCPRCGTSLSEHEMLGSYRDLTHIAMVVALPLLAAPAGFDASLPPPPAPGADPAQAARVAQAADAANNAEAAPPAAAPGAPRILVWTTTPWTLPANVALAVNPAIDYLEVEIKGSAAPLIVAAASARNMLLTGYEVRRTFKGQELVGALYETCFPELPAQRGVVHRIVAWDDVDPEEGTGVVHVAPGCGEEDYELGKRLGLPVLAPIDEAGIYVDGFGWLEGKAAQDVAGEIGAELERQGKLFRKGPYAHRYAVCWRCKTEIVYRPVRVWYIRVGDLKPRLLSAARQVRWEPDHVAKRMEDWLANMGDWNISRTRYYGLPLPFYPCACGELIVVGSKAELRRLGGAGVDALPSLHRPWIDAIELQCPRCGAAVKRIPEVGDVWLDAGIVPYSTLGYFDRRADWQRFYPAEWITEMREQVHLWFYSMLLMGVVLHNRAPYDRVLAYESVISEEGSRFSKTGYMIHFDEAVEETGADAMRYLFCRANVAASVRFGYALGDEVKRKLLTLWHVASFFVTYARLDRPRLEPPRRAGQSAEPGADWKLIDRWLMARGNVFLRAVTTAMGAYDTAAAVKEIESFVDDLSNWYVRINRRRFWKSSDPEDRERAYWCLHSALRLAVQALAPIAPFITEKVWQEAIRAFEPGAAISVHLSGWPERQPAGNDYELIDQVARVRKVVGLARELRSELQIKVRQPLARLYVVADAATRRAVEALREVVADEVNVKRVEVLAGREELETSSLGLDFGAAGPLLKGDVKRVKELLARLPPEEMAAAVAAFRGRGEVALPGYPQPLPARLLRENRQPREGVRVTAAEDVVVGLDTELSDELLAEGVAREVVRQVQVLRKDKKLDVSDRIELCLFALDDGIARAIVRYRDYIAQETLAETFSTDEDKLDNSPGGDEDPLTVNGKPIRVSLARAAVAAS